MKRCPRCGDTKPTTDFYANRARGSDGLQGWCIACVLENQRNRYRLGQRKRTQRASNLRCLYGLELEDHDRLLESQGHACAICRREVEEFCVDHDHETGRVRGLLCHDCNLGLGKFEDSSERLFAAAEYVARSLSTV